MTKRSDGFTPLVKRPDDFTSLQLLVIHQHLNAAMKAEICKFNPLSSSKHKSQLGHEIKFSPLPLSDSGSPEKRAGARLVTTAISCC